MILSPVSNTEPLDQGIIVEGIPHPIFKNLKLSASLNPTCLWKNSKVDNAIIAYLIPAKFIIDNNEQWAEFLKSLDRKYKTGSEEISKKKLKNIEKFLGGLIDNDEPRRHFYIRGLETIGLPDCFIDFQQITSIPYSQFLEKAKPVAKINCPWREKLISHYAGYMMRIGVKRFSDEERKQIISNLIKPIRLPS